MIYCGLKLTHDSTIAIFDNEKLVFSTEIEKINNNNRHAILSDNEIIEFILSENNIRIKDVDQFIVDGWIGDGLRFGEIRTVNRQKKLLLKVAPYHEKNCRESILKKFQFEGLKIGSSKVKFSSFTHVAGHVFSAYCTSEFAKRGEDSLILVWDGGMHPRIYFYSPRLKSPVNLGPLFYLGANIYSIFCQNFGPFKINTNVIKDELSIAGKVMAYVAYGKKNNLVLRVLRETYQSTINESRKYRCISNYPFLFTEMFKRNIFKEDVSDEDIITTFHFFLEEMLLLGLKNKLIEHKIKCTNICIAGGAALNIKWNNAIRMSNLFKEIWIPPFPNDSGSAIGSVCCEIVKTKNGSTNIDWNVYQGPNIKKSSHNSAEWVKSKLCIADLAKILYNEGEPVIVLNGNSEIGPRALGNRSILASPTLPYMKDVLNRIKYRESFRPVAPICIEDKAHLYFDPGFKDPYMLFEHNVRTDFREILPAICHKDGTARLQTVSAQSSPFLYMLLVEFEKLSGIPILCNTSANFKGSGFFPDIDSAVRWNKVNYIWSDDTLLERKVKIMVSPKTHIELA